MQDKPLVQITKSMLYLAMLGTLGFALLQKADTDFAWMEILTYCLMLLPYVVLVALANSGNRSSYFAWVVFGLSVLAISAATTVLYYDYTIAATQQGPIALIVLPIVQLATIVLLASVASFWGSDI